MEIKDLAGLEKPVTKLLEMINDTTGVLYEPTKIRRKAQAEADAKIIQAKADIEISDIQRRGLIRLLQEEGIKQNNIENILGGMIPLLTHTSEPEKIDPDWLLLFIEKGKNISSKQMQDLWSRVLATESNQPNSFSKRTLVFLSTIDKKDANLFTELCRFTIKVDDIYPILDTDSDICKSRGLTFEGLSHLDDIGLIQFSEVSDYYVTEIDKNTPVTYFDQEILARINDSSLHIGKALFTNIGKELFTISGASFDNGIYQYLLDKIKNNTNINKKANQV